VSMTPQSLSPQSLSPQDRRNRRLKNYLLDRRFQLKYSAYLGGLTLVLSLGLGLLLWHTSGAVIAQSRQTVEQGNQVVQRGREMLVESQKVSEVVKMSIVKDPVYSENPELLDVFKADAAKRAERLNQQQKNLEQQATALRQRSNEIAQQQKTMLLTLTSVLTLLVVLISLAGIVVTHKVAGPIYKMKRQIRDVGEGKLRVPAPLRKGDDLVHFFEAFEKMVVKLRARQQVEIDRLEQAIQQLGDKVSSDDLDSLRKLARDMKSSLDVQSQ
jgi:methyl-accepting chemotaxis protein